RQIDLNLDGSGAGHGLLHEYFGADILWAGTQLTANLSRNGFSPSAAPKNTRTFIFGQKWTKMRKGGSQADSWRGGQKCRGWYTRYTEYTVGVPSVPGVLGGVLIGEEFCHEAGGGKVC